MRHLGAFGLGDLLAVPGQGVAGGLRLAELGQEAGPGDPEAGVVAGRLGCRAPLDGPERVGRAAQAVQGAGQRQPDLQLPLARPFDRFFEQLERLVEPAPGGEDVGLEGLDGEVVRLDGRGVVDDGVDAGPEALVLGDERLLAEPEAADLDQERDVVGILRQGPLHLVGGVAGVLPGHDPRDRPPRLGGRGGHGRRLLIGEHRLALEAERLVGAAHRHLDLGPPVLRDPVGHRFRSLQGAVGVPAAELEEGRGGSGPSARSPRRRGAGTGRGAAGPR